jgi:hypothetical protein
MEEQPGLHGIAAFHINSGSDTSKMLNFTDVFLGSRQDLMKFVLERGENYRKITLYLSFPLQPFRFRQGRSVLKRDISLPMGTAHPLAPSFKVKKT